MQFIIFTRACWVISRLFLPNSSIACIIMTFEIQCTLYTLYTYIQFILNKATLRIDRFACVLVFFSYYKRNESSVRSNHCNFIKQSPKPFNRFELTPITNWFQYCQLLFDLNYRSRLPVDLASINRIDSVFKTSLEISDVQSISSESFTFLLSTQFTQLFAFHQNCF